jgi:serine/threonine protein kinase
VSIKAVSAEITETTKELRILEHIQKDTSQHPGREYVPRLLDHFYETKGGYRHLFLVLEFLGPPVSDVQCFYPNGRFSPASSRRFSRQLLLAVQYLHSIGIVHGGEMVV